MKLIIEKDYTEFINFKYTVDLPESFMLGLGSAAYIAKLAEDIEPPHEDDALERQSLIEAARALVYSKRQMTLQPTYQGHAACIASVSFMVRNDTLFLQAFYRSQHIANVPYDSVTLIMLVETMRKKLQISGAAEITVTVASFHYKK